MIVAFLYLGEDYSKELPRCSKSFGIIESVSLENEESNPNIHYLPHHAVVREDKSTTKVRIVFDGSARLNNDGLSINDCLECGPNLVPFLFDILIRFRSHPYALVADIEKVFHMISIKEEHRSEIVVYRFCRLVFGLKPSPAILGAQSSIICCNIRKVSLK